MACGIYGKSGSGGHLLSVTYGSGRVVEGSTPSSSTNQFTIQNVTEQRGRKLY